MYSQDTKTQNQDYSDFGLLGHFDVPQHGDGQQSLGGVSKVVERLFNECVTYVEPVRNNRENADGVGRVDNILAASAATLRNSVIPLLGDGHTLENIPEKDAHSVETNDDETNLEDGAIDFLGRQSKEEYTDAELEEHHGQNISNRGERLPLNRHVSQIWSGFFLCFGTVP